MYPILVKIGPFAISSFGFFLALGFLVGVFTVWRIARSYDIEEERIIDLSFLVALGALLGARLYFVGLNSAFFDDLTKIFLIQRFPGLSFWGGLMGGFLMLWFWAGKFKIRFWQLLDFASVGALVVIIFGDLGCFLGGCQFGVVSSLPWAMPVVGVIGKRLPISLYEAILLSLVFFYLWRQVIRFHFEAKIAGLFLIFIGIIKFSLEFYRGDSRFLSGSLTYGHVLAFLSIILGVVIFYQQSKRHFFKDLKYIVTLPFTEKERKEAIVQFKKGWYNRRINWKIWLANTQKKLTHLLIYLKRRLNVKSTPTDFK